MTKTFKYPSNAHPCGTKSDIFCITSGMTNLGTMIPPMAVMMIKTDADTDADRNTVFEREAIMMPNPMAVKEMANVKSVRAGTFLMVSSGQPNRGSTKTPSENIRTA